MKLMISEDTEIVVGGKIVLLERGDQLVIENKDDASQAIEQLRAEYKKAVKAGDTEEASRIATLLDGLNISLD